MSGHNNKQTDSNKQILTGDTPKDSALDFDLDKYIKVINLKFQETSLHHMKRMEKLKRQTKTLKKNDDVVVAWASMHDNKQSMEKEKQGLEPKQSPLPMPLLPRKISTGTGTAVEESPTCKSQKADKVYTRIALSRILELRLMVLGVETMTEPSFGTYPGPDDDELCFKFDHDMMKSRADEKKPCLVNRLPSDAWEKWCKDGGVICFAIQSRDLLKVFFADTRDSSVYHVTDFDCIQFFRDEANDSAAQLRPLGVQDLHHRVPFRLRLQQCSLLLRRGCNPAVFFLLP
ncbi:unnamed protein product [Cuscuta campestris]|uniref:Uncharacterized protein n=1 Tax=Cuscuta campestris TaxID=132261 RepID=A0A484MGK9_9ASTE|nr:unnamed protein product [Cuscuta campestris]